MTALQKLFKSFYFFLVLIYQQKSLIFTMSKKEIKVQHTGSFLGLTWKLIHPIVMITLFWVVFNLGFRVKPLNNAPFVAWLASGMAAWFAFADMLGGSSDVIVGNANLIKKTLFQSQILPLVKIVSCLITHAFFLVVLTLLLIVQHVPLTFYYFQFVYYLFCMCMLAIGIGWATSALNVFVRDVGQIVAVVLQVGFWATPIFWDISIMPKGLQKFLVLNPMYYIVQGYRDSFIYASPFWKHPYLSLYFWCVTIFLFVLGASIFRKLKPQFADVL